MSNWVDGASEKGRKVDRPARAFFDDFDFVGAQICDGPALRIGDAHVEPHELTDRSRFVFSRRLE